MVAKSKKNAKMAKSAKKTAKTSKKASSPKVVAPKKISIIKEPLTKSSLLNTLSDSTGLSRKEVSTVVETFMDAIFASIKKGGSGQFVLPGIFKMMIVRKPATKARKGINPFTGEEIMFKAKPARNVVKIRPLKKLKDAAA